MRSYYVKFQSVHAEDELISSLVFLEVMFTEFIIINVMCNVIQLDSFDLYHSYLHCRPYKRITMSGFLFKN